MTRATESKAETMDTQDGMVAKDAGLTVLETLQPGAGSDSGRGMTLEAARAELDGTAGWQGFDHAAARPGFDRRMEQEFPAHAGEWVDPVSRRGFMKLMGASLAMAGLAGCTKQPDEPIYPYIKAAGRPHPGQAKLLCNGLPVCYRRASFADQERCVQADQGRWQS